MNYLHRLCDAIKPLRSRLVRNPRSDLFHSYKRQFYTPPKVGSARHKHLEKLGRYVRRALNGS